MMAHPWPRSGLILQLTRGAMEPGPCLSSGGEVDALARVHLRLWDLEDRVRDRALADRERVEAKEEIDRCNQERWRLVESMDEALFARLPAFPSSLPLATDTPAGVVDRLIIMAIKEAHLLRATQSDPSLAPRHQQARAQLEALAQAHDELLDDLASGRRRVMLVKQLKMYAVHPR